MPADELFKFRLENSAPFSVRVEREDTSAPLAVIIRLELSGGDGERFLGLLRALPKEDECVTS